ncbi:UDP-N-acetylmuramate--L-alanine ligase [Mucilaginibacter sp. KACC 22063]|uniref:UDP-N-acetylmuramate--L-alanine ligase n=1 Tax=Mucilaginibacter sp. KACC 22063 TaxID=3025666 RepID=UPI002366109D|nr:UDP-N-acetylmuramate--L-alanine ligase [Mucilaginibacter sp. KACC 22063]WDF56550.1 UDP-N-acetylmuramate--L-alanine ligase [Mucilaginibacter sp. KACC 22063]
MKLNNIQRVYLVGIGGIGMSGLARYFAHLGCAVYGYDKTSTPLTTALESEGMAIVYEDDSKNVPADFHFPDEHTLIIWTPAIPKDSSILNFFINKGFTLYKRSQVLGIISEGMYAIAVAGTHGKTTTSTMVAHILKHSGKDCSAFLGGIASNYDTNVLYGKNNIMVVEADEYDRSFLTLHPDIAIVTSMDADHLDIYGDHSHLAESFRLFVGQLKANGKVIAKKGLEIESDIAYSINEQADAYAENLRVEKGEFYFDFKNAEVNIADIHLGIPGIHNVENAVAAIQAALLVGVEPEQIKAALTAFKGVKRRFEYLVKNDAHIYIDDYAHHPEELRACISSVKRIYPDKKLTVVFQPHLFTRTRDFADGFAEVLSMADELILLDIYPARELPIEGITSKMLLDRVTSAGKKLLSKAETLAIVKQEKPELLLTVGAGDIDQLVEPLKQILSYE